MSLCLRGEQWLTTEAQIHKETQPFALRRWAYRCLRCATLTSGERCRVSGGRCGVVDRGYVGVAEFFFENKNYEASARLSVIC